MRRRGVGGGSKNCPPFQGVGANHPLVTANSDVPCGNSHSQDTLWHVSILSVGIQLHKAFVAEASVLKHACQDGKS